jgi:hypothetical protein
MQAKHPNIRQTRRKPKELLPRKKRQNPFLSSLVSLSPIRMGFVSKSRAFSAVTRLSQKK